MSWRNVYILVYTFSHSVGCFFTVGCVLCGVFNFDVVQFIFSSVVCAFGIIANSLPNPMS